MLHIFLTLINSQVQSHLVLGLRASLLSRHPTYCIPCLSKFTDENIELQMSLKRCCFFLKNLISCTGRAPICLDCKPVTANNDNNYSLSLIKHV